MYVYLKYFKKIYLYSMPDYTIGGFSLKIKKRIAAHCRNDGKYDVWFCFDPVHFKPEV